NQERGGERTGQERGSGGLHVPGSVASERAPGQAPAGPGRPDARPPASPPPLASPGFLRQDGVSMSQIDQVEAFSAAVGVRLRKVPGNDVLGMVRDLLVDLAIVGVEERVKARGYDLSDDDLCEVNAEGQISSL